MTDTTDTTVTIPGVDKRYNPLRYGLIAAAFFFQMAGPTAGLVWRQGVRRQDARSVPVWMESEEDSRISINRIHH